MRTSTLTRLTAGLATAALVATACGTGTSNDTGGTDSGGEEPKELTVWFPGNSPDEMELVTKTLVPEFEKANDVEVKVTYVDWPDISPKLNSAFAGGIAPDVFGHGVAAAAGFAASDRLEPLDDYIEQMPQQDQDDLSRPIDQSRVDGTAYMIPLSYEGRLIAYRKDLFKAAGLDPDNPPTTWADAYEAAQTLTERSGNKIKVSGLWLPSSAIGSTQAFTALLGSEGGSLLTEDGSASAWNSPEGVRALEYYANLYSGDAAVADQIGLEVPDPAHQPLATGAAAMQDINSAGLLQMVAAVPDVADQLAVMAPLEGPASAQTFGGPGPGLFINKDSDSKDLAWKFLEFMASPDVSQKYAQVIGNVPARASAADSPAVTGNPLLKPFVDALAADAYAPKPNVPKWVEARDVLAKHIEGVLHGKVSAEEALKAAADEADPLLAS